MVIITLALNFKIMMVVTSTEDKCMYYLQLQLVSPVL